MIGIICLKILLSVKETLKSEVNSLRYNYLITIDDIILQLTNNYDDICIKTVRNAYEYASEKHAGQKRESGEPYIRHPMRVARLIAEWGFDAQMVCAALLHDVIEYCGVSYYELEKEFGKRIADLVDTVSKFDERVAPDKNLPKEVIENQANVALQKNVNEESLFLKVADRIDNLYTIEAMTEEMQLRKVEETKLILLPMIIEERAFRIVEELYELCFEIENRVQYNKITDAYNRIFLENSVYSKKTIDYMQNLFKENNQELPNELQKYSKRMRRFIVEKPSKLSIFRNACNGVGNMIKDFDGNLVKNRIIIYNITIVLENDILKDSSINNLFDVFFDYYTKTPLYNHICVCDCQPTKQSDTTFLLICDKMDNYYRVFLKTEKDYMRFKFGNIVDAGYKLAFSDVNTYDPRDTYKKKIKVYDEDGNARHIDAGASVLDFAFMIHTQVGLHFDYAKVNNNETHHGASKRLNENDMVSIIKSKNETAELKWFSYCKTAKATHELIKYFSYIMDNK